MTDYKRTEFQIAELIYKSVSKTISVEEQAVLDQWLSVASNLELYNKITNRQNIQDKLAIYRQIETEKAYKNIEDRLEETDASFKGVRLKSYLKYAAVLILCLALGYALKINFFNDNEPFVVPYESVTLQLENGTIKVISEDGTSQVLDANGHVIGSQTGNKIAYNSDEVQATELVYNTLKVPYGKRFEIVLSDGTKVHLNAGTSLKYPVQFIKDQKREVYLTGEAFFSVSKDENHPFLVHTNDLNVQVLGTAFNFSSYPEDDAVNVVLVEGSVNLFAANNHENKTLLSPGFMGTYQRAQSGEISTKPVITDVYTSWIHGGLVFRNMTFGNILKKMERHFNVTIINNNVELTDEKFNASFRDEPIEKILEYFKITYNIEYTIKNNIITIN